MLHTDGWFCIRRCSEQADGKYLEKKYYLVADMPYTVRWGPTRMVCLHRTSTGSFFLVIIP